MKRKRGLGESTLMSLWRKAVLAKWGNKCFFCGNTNISELECHHIIKRRHKLTRYLAENGILACRYSCHAFADSLAGEEKIRKAIGEEAWERLAALEQQIFKDWLFKNAMTENEFLEQKKKELDKGG